MLGAISTEFSWTRWRTVGQCSSRGDDGGQSGEDSSVELHDDK